MNGHDIVVIGASAGGVEALPRLVAGLDTDYSGAVFVVLHLAAGGESFLPNILTRAGALKAIHPDDKQKVEVGVIYVAPPNHHLWLEDGCVRVTMGPRVNRHRPAIDPLFESAAHVYRQRVVGVILTGSMDDGAAGLHTVKKCGGVTIVQHPSDAFVSGMPENALRKVAADHVVPLEKIAGLLGDLAERPIKKKKINCPKMRFAMNACSRRPDEMQRAFGPPSSFICPECGGPLWELRDGKVVKFRCLVGHSYTPESLLEDEREGLERALWTATKTLEERATLLKKLAEDADESRRPRASRTFSRRAEELEEQAQTIRRIATRLDQG